MKSAIYHSGAMNTIGKMLIGFFTTSLLFLFAVPKMSKKRYVWYFIFGLLVSFFLAAGQAIANGEAINITFDDTALNDIIGVKINLDSAIYLNQQISSGFQNSGSPYVSGGNLVEFGRVNFFIADGVGNPLNIAATMREPSADPFNQPVSDILYLIGTPATLQDTIAQITGTAYDIFFESDYLGSPQLLPGFIDSGPFVEHEGGIIVSVGLPIASGGLTALTVVGNSDVNNSEVPEPSTILLVVVGLAGVEILKRKFRK